MNIETQLIDCPKCGQKFELTEHNPDGCGWESESYSCPHDGCTYSGTRKSSGYFSTQQIKR